MRFVREFEVRDSGDHADEMMSQIGEIFHLQ